MIVDKINAYLSSEGKTVEEAILAEVATIAKYTFARQFGERKESSGSLRLSSIGRCVRQNAYSVLGFDANGKEIDSRSKMVFFQGDMAELAIIQLAKVAGCNILNCGMDQKGIELYGVPGHPDGILRNGEDRLVEVKSMSSFGFDKFDKGTIDESYVYQVNAYMEALGLKECVFIGLNKDSGVLGQRIVKKDPAIVAAIRARVDIINAATKEGLPERPYSPDEKGYLPWNCLYCAYWKTCRPDAEKVLVSRSYKLKEVVK